MLAAQRLTAFTILRSAQPIVAACHPVAGQLQHAFWCAYVCSAGPGSPAAWQRFDAADMLVMSCLSFTYVVAVSLARRPRACWRDAAGVELLGHHQHSAVCSGFVRGQRVAAACSVPGAADCGMLSLRNCTARVCPTCGVHTPHAAGFVVQRQVPSQGVQLSRAYCVLYALAGTFWWQHLLCRVTVLTIKADCTFVRVACLCSNVQTGACRWLSHQPNTKHNICRV